MIFLIFFNHYWRIEIVWYFWGLFDDVSYGKENFAALILRKHDMDENFRKK